jgi:selenocysteine lyase/cysteine desulfurase
MLNQPEVVLRYSQGDAGAKDFRVGKEDILIGRASECDIHLEDQQVSRFHASVRIAADGIWLLDMDSKNGTLIDDKPIPPNRRIPLQAEQSFNIGSYTFTAIVHSAPAADQTIVQPGVARGYMYDLDALRKVEFPQMMDRTSLDNAAAAPPPMRTVKKMKQMTEQKIGTTEWHSEKFIFEVNGAFVTSVAKLLNAKSPDEIVVVDGCSIGLNLIAQSLVTKPGDNIVFCDLEHPANAYCWMSLQRDGVVIKQVPSVNGGLTLDALRRVVDDRTRVVAASAFQFFSGHRTDLAAIGKFCRERNIIFVVDAIQAVGHMPIDVQKMKIDVLVTGGHKSIMAGPCVGFMYVRDEVCSTLQPRVIGALSTADWSYYLKYDITPHAGAWRFLIGTPNMVGMAAVVESITLINELTREAIDRHTTNLAAHTLELARARGYELTTTPGEHGSIATFKSKLDNEKTSAYLEKLEEQEKIIVGKHLDRQGQPHLRLSFHCYNTEEDVVRSMDALDKMK